jgi:inorganic pyrophosphatase
MIGMIDQGEQDDKIVCVHADDPEYRDYNNLTELPHHKLDELKIFFEDYKKLENKMVKVTGFSGPEEAKKIVMEGIENYKKYVEEQKNRPVDMMSPKYVYLYIFFDLQLFSI